MKWQKNCWLSLMLNKEQVLKFALPIPPSTNGYLYPKRVGNYLRLAETAKSKKWKQKATFIIKEAIIDQEWYTAPRGMWLDVYVDYYFEKKGQDPNNYLKLLYDVMENCGVYENDDMAKPQTGLVVIDKFNPRLEITVSMSNQIGVFNNESDRDSFIEDYSDSMTVRSFDALMKKLDESRITENTYYTNDKKLRKSKD